MIVDSAKIILIVDDLPDNLRVLSTALIEKGFQIRCAKSGAIALMAVETTSPALILLDINMPEMDGYEVCQKLKENPKTQHIPIIFLSALDDIFDKSKAFSLGGVDYITKPFQIEEVLIRINHQLELQAAKIAIKTLNQELEHRVQKRTTELVKLNEVLKSEIHERKIIEECLKLSEERLESIFRSLEDILVSTAVDYSRLFYLNPAIENVYGYTISTFIKFPNLLFDVIHPEDRSQIKEAKLAMEITSGFSEEYRIVRPDQEIRWVSDRSSLVYDQDNNVIRIDSIIRDITEQKLAQKQLVYDALHDALTGLPNRNLFMDRLNQIIKHRQCHPNYLFAVFFIDLDRFKMINDSLGHGVGDQFLQQVAKLLKDCLGSVDTVARLGGDEFTILLDDISEIQEVLMIADHILTQFSQPFVLENQIIFSSASIGIVIAEAEYDNGLDILRDADIAMYRAKQLGKGRYVLFDQEMYEKNLNAIQIEHDLRSALERNEFKLQYQPIISLNDNKLAGFEALIRWKHPEKGLVSPVEFIPIAEDTGLIVPIGDWVMEQACQQLHLWQTQFSEAISLKMSINVASQQIQEKSFLEKLDAALMKTNLDNKTLRLEITETTMMDQGEETITKLKELRARNIQLSLDDFGQGYSSLSYLHRFPINILKIDRAFVNQMTLGEENLAIIRTIIILAHTLNMDVVAEGVETQEQAQLLRDLGCEFAQGYLFAKPLTVEDIERQFFSKTNV